MKRFLTEGSHYDKDAIKMLINSGLFNEQQATGIINGLKDVDIHAFNHCPNWLLKYLKGIARMLIDDVKKGANAENWLNDCLAVFEPYLTWVKQVRDKLPDNEKLQLDDEFVNKMSYKEVQEKWEKIQDEMDEESRAELAKMGFNKKTANYKLYPINSYDEMHDQFGGRATGDGSSDAYAGGGGTAWCHTNSRGVYDSWTRGGDKFFVLAKNNWKDIPFNRETNQEMHGKDEYGNSLMAIRTNRYGRLKNVTLRCNHCGVNTSADNQYTTYAELSKIAGFNVEEEVKKYCEERIEKVNADTIFYNRDGVYGRVIIDRYDDNYTEDDRLEYRELIERITEVNIPEGVTKLADGTFSNCIQLQKVSFPSTLKEIGKDCFYNTRITEVNIPDSVQIIGRAAFNGCNDLRKVHFPTSLSDLRDGAFYGTALESVKINSNLQTISDNCFNDCVHLQAVSIPSSVKTIGINAFKNCISLTAIRLDSVEQIGAYAFIGDKNLELIVSLNSCRVIDKGAFEGCEKLPDLKLPLGINIQNGAFNGCTFTLDFSDESVDEESSTVFGNEAFRGFKGRLVKLPNGLKRIPYDLFSRSGLSEITIPSTVEIIDEEAFAESALKKIVIPENVEVLGNGVFKRCGSLEEVVIESTKIDVIPYGCFAGCNKLKSIDLSRCGGLISIEDYAFEKCSKLTSVKLPESLLQIKSYAFSLCKNLQDIEIPSSVTKIGSKAFCDCRNLASVTIPGGVKIVEAYAFSGCINLTSVVVQEGVEGLNAGVFEGCENLQVVKLPNTLKGISTEVFYQCSNLRNLRLPEGLEVIKMYAFSESENLQKLYIPTSVETVTSGSLDFDSDDITIYTKNEKVIEICKRMNIKCSTDISQFVGESLIKESLDEKLNNPKIEEINDFIEDIYDLRQQGLQTEGEYSLGNLLFKEFRNMGYLDNLKQMKNELTGKDLSLEGMDESLLTEGTKYDKQAEKILVDSGLVNEEVAHKIIDALFTQDIHAFVHSPAWLEKYLKGIARIIVKECNGDKTKLKPFLEECPSVFDEYLEYVKENRDKIGTSIDNEFINKMSYQDVINKVEEVRAERDRKSKEELKNMQLSKSSNFSIVPIESFEDFNNKYGGKATGDGSSDKFAGGGGTAWCHANSNPTYDSWVNKGKYRFFVLQNNNWKDITFDKKSNEESNGKDAYGNSLIAILTDKYGRLIKNTLRCNHCGVRSNADRAYGDYAELSKIAGFNVEEEIAKYCEKYDPNKPNFEFSVNQDTGWLIGIVDVNGDDLDTEDPDTYNSIEELIIPDNLGITEIGYSAFSFMRGLRKVVIPKGVTRIGEDAFRGCTSLSEVVLPEGLTAIGESAFTDCGGEGDSLLHIELPSTLEEIDEYAFNGSFLGPLLKLPKDLKHIGISAFRSCALCKIIFDCDVLLISDWAFSYNDDLKDVVFNKDATYDTGENALDNIFKGCKKLTEESKEAITEHIMMIDTDLDLDDLEDLEDDDLEDLPDFDYGDEDDEYGYQIDDSDDEDINLNDINNEDDEPYQWRNVDDWNWGDDWND